MPSPDDKLSDGPAIIPQRDDDGPYRPRAEARERSVREPKPPKADAAPRSGGGGALAVAGLVLALAGIGAAAVLYQQTRLLEVALQQSNQRIADLEGRLSSTDDSVNQSTATLGIKLKEVSGEVDKLWASAWKKNGARIDDLAAAQKKADDAARRQFAALSAAQDKLKEQVASAQELGIALDAMRDQQKTVETAVGRMNGTVNGLANTQRAQEARLKEAEQWVQSNIEFRKQVTQRLTRLENPPTALAE